MVETHPYRVVLADDHVLIRHGIKNIISQNDDLEVVGEVGDGEELLELLDRQPVDLVILDISMPKIGGMEAVGQVKAKCSWVKVLILTMHKSKQYFYHSMTAGADGYMVKDDSDEELLIAIRKIQSGKSYISPFIAEDFADDVINTYRGERKSPFQQLTKREKEILQLVVDGYTSKQMADNLGLSPRTVDHHRSSLLRKFQMKNSVDLVNFAVRNGFVTPVKY
ncbi:MULTISPECIES: response regulator transcription factor [Desulfosediminicola]|uniref:response regulator n=1 Tax=Desulfosediminicola TaxID=2886823 RepID=UPI0010AC3F06|nr:response regulator transcription factor [Desulfosediminicola ganghwensis]